MYESVQNTGGEQDVLFGWKLCEDLLAIYDGYLHAGWRLIEEGNEDTRLLTDGFCSASGREMFLPLAYWFRLVIIAEWVFFIIFIGFPWPRRSWVTRNESAILPPLWSREHDA